MLYEALLRAPVRRERPEVTYDSEAQEAPGVPHTVPLRYGVGIIGETVEAIRREEDLPNIGSSSLPR